MVCTQIHDELLAQEADLVKLEMSCVATESEATYKANQLLLDINTTFGCLIGGDFTIEVMSVLGEEEKEMLKVSKLFHNLCMEFKSEVGLKKFKACMDGLSRASRLPLPRWSILCRLKKPANLHISSPNHSRRSWTPP